MRKSSIRAFGTAIFLTGALLTLADRFDLHIGLPAIASSSDKEVIHLQKKLDAANKEIASLKAAKQSASESNSNKSNQTSTSTGNNSSSTEEADNSSSTSKKEDEEIVTMQLNIYRGISTYDIAQMLEDEGIITNSVEMDLLLANPKYSRNLQIGTYEVSSTMSLEEIAKLITRQ